jgi:hypothetical protein
MTNNTVRLVKTGDKVSTVAWGRTIKGRVSATHNDGTCTIEWYGGGVSLNATVVNGIVPRRHQ